MVSSVLLCDTADEIAMLRRAAVDHPDLFVEVSTDALRALEAAARTRPDVMLCRLTMDGFTGTELLGRAREASPSSRIVVRVRADDVARLTTSFAGGAAGAVAIDDTSGDVMRVVEATATGAIALSPRVADRLAASLSDSIASSARIGAELEELRHSVSQGTTAKADFLSNISHELRTPVTVAKGIAYVLRNPAVGEDERAEFLAQLQGSLDKLMGIIDEIITMSELERGTSVLTFAEVDLASTVRPPSDGHDRGLDRGEPAHGRRRASAGGRRHRAPGERVPLLPRGRRRRTERARDVRRHRGERHRPR
jgi:signal transduction histidine kinase